MKMLSTLLSEFKSRRDVIRNKESTRGQRFFALLEIFCFPVSMLAVILLFVQLILFLFHCGSVIPGWWLHYVSPILLAGAVGYLTNWLAIMMLFRPYTEKKWLVVWPQGMIPRNKAAIAKKMGYAVGNDLLPPEYLAKEITDWIQSSLSNPSTIKKIKNYLKDFLLLHQNVIVDFLIPEIENTLVDAVDRLVTPDNIKDFWGKELKPRLESEETRTLIAKNIVKIGQENTKELTTAIQNKLREYLSRRLDFVPGFCRDDVVDMVISFFADRERMQAMIRDWLGAPETQEMLRDKMINIGVKLNEWVQSPDAMVKLGSFSDDAKKSLKSFLSSYLHTALPVFAQNALDSEKLWEWMDNKMLPGARDELVTFIKDNKQLISDEFALAKRVENAINNQKVEEFHEMINSVAAQHLGAIQVLGFLLGVLVGVLQLAQTLVCK